MLILFLFLLFFDLDLGWIAVLVMLNAEFSITQIALQLHG